MNWHLIPRRRQDAAPTRAVDPFSLIEQHFQRFFPESWAPFPGAPEGGRRALATRVDLRETPEELRLDVELPGVEEQDIEVSITGDLLTVRAEKKAEKKEEQDGWYLEERSFGTFERSLRLPVEVQSDRAVATFEKGVLHLRLPKTVQAKDQTRRIAVQSGSR